MFKSHIYLPTVLYQKQKKLFSKSVVLKNVSQYHKQCSTML